MQQKSQNDAARDPHVLADRCFSAKFEASGENLRWMSLSGFSALEGRKLAGAAQRGRQYYLYHWHMILRLFPLQRFDVSAKELHRPTESLSCPSSDPEAVSRLHHVSVSAP